MNITKNVLNFSEKNIFKLFLKILTKNLISDDIYVRVENMNKNCSLKPRKEAPDVKKY